MQPIIAHVINTVNVHRYEEIRAIVDKADAYWQSVTGGKRNYLTAEEAAHPDYAACNNEMRGDVEQFELLNNPPERFVAYVGEPLREGDANSFLLTTWPGQPIGTIHVTSKWRVHSHWGSHMYAFHAHMGGREYFGRGFGQGMCVSLRETAASKRGRA